MAYSDAVLDHYENPRNVGVLDKSSKDVGISRPTPVLPSSAPPAKATFSAT